MKKSVRIEKTRAMLNSVIATKGFNHHQAIQLRIKLAGLLSK